MKIVGAWPDNNRGNNYIAALVGINILFFAVIPQTAFIFQVWPDFELIHESLALANFTVSMSVVKLFTMCINREELKILVTKIYEDWDREKNEFEWKIMRSNAEIAKVISLCVYVFTMSATILNFLEELYKRLWSQKDIRDWLFLSYFPTDFFKSPAYELTYTLQSMASLIAGLIYTLLISFCSMLILHVNGQLSILEHNLESLINSKEFKNTKEFLLKLRVFVTRHNDLNNFTTVIENTFNKVFLMEMLIFSIQLCLQGYHVMIVNQTRGISLYEIVFWFAYVFTILTNLFVICYLGEKLKSSTSKLQFSIYKSKWYNLSSLEARNLLMIFLRTETPLQITAGKFCALSYETFSAALKRSIAFLSLLLTMHQKLGT